jgi:hypothetical protein
MFCLSLLGDRMTKSIWSVSLVFALALSNGKAIAGYDIVEIKTIQIVGRMSGTIKDRTGAPVAGAKVAEVAQDWQTAIQSAVTDSKGWFSMTPQTNNKTHYIVVTAPNFDPLRVRVRLNRESTKQLELQLEVGT